MNSHAAQAQGAERRRLEAAIAALAAERGFAALRSAAEALLTRAALSALLDRALGARRIPPPPGQVAER